MISIIIPVYNASQYIDKCMKCVVNQTYKDIEIILVNDGSTDGSDKICNQWEALDSRVKVIHKINTGVAAARNTGLEKSQGDYIMFVDSDDEIYIGLCQFLLDILNDNQADISICDAVHVLGDNISYQTKGSLYILSNEEAVIDLWYQKSFLPSTWGKLYKKEIFNKIRFVEGVTFDDIHIIHKILLAADKIVYSTAQLYAYIHRENSIMTSDFTEKNLEELDICYIVLKFAKHYPSLLNAAKAYAVSGALRVYLNAPKNALFQKGIADSKILLSNYGKSVLHDPQIRGKTKYALILYFYFRPFIKIIYKRVNRWS